MLAFPVSPRFVEAAAAIGVGYLAFEVLLLPQAGHRWLAVAGVGLLLGLGVPTGESAVYYMALVACTVAVAAAVGLCRLAPRRFSRPVAASLLLIAAGWFATQFIR